MQQPIKGKKKGTNVSNQVKLDAKDPIPFEYGGTVFSFLQGQKYIPFLHPKDDFFKTLLEAKTLSATHNACIETKKKYCAGTGLYDVNGKEFSPEIISWLKRINARGESAVTISKKAFGGRFTFGNVPVEIVRFSVAGKKMLNVYVHNVLEWRLSWPDETGNVTTGIQSKLFLREGIISGDMLKNARVLPIYDPSRPNAKENWFEDPKERGVYRTLVWLKNDMDGYDHYGMPSSIASLIYQVNEYKFARYNLDNLENNLVLGGILALKGNVSEPEATKIAKAIINTHTGDGKRGRFAVVSSEDGLEKSDFHQFNTQGESSFLKGDESVVQKIIFSNEWDSMLAGITQMHSMGRGNAYIRTLYQIKKTTVIDPEQAYQVENLWVIIQQIAASWNLPEFAGYELGIQDIDPISILSDVDPTPAIKVNEVRASVGLELDPSPKGEMYMGELAGQQKNQTTGGDNVQS